MVWIHGGAYSGGDTHGFDGTPQVEASQVGCMVSDCHFAGELDHFIPGFPSYSVAIFLK
jgi:hypothetical protein